MSHSIHNLDYSHGAAENMRISQPELLHTLCKEVFKGDIRAENIVKNHFAPEVSKPELAVKKPQDYLFHMPY